MKEILVVFLVLRLIVCIAEVFYVPFCFGGTFLVLFVFQIVKKLLVPGQVDSFFEEHLFDLLKVDIVHQMSLYFRIFSYGWISP